MKKSSISLCLLSTILFSNNITNIEQQFSEEQNWLEAETFVVSASRIKENIKKTPANVTVIDTEQIEAMGAENIYDILTTVPGINVSKGNVYTKKVSVAGIQTWFSEKVLFLLDGHSLNTGVNNGSTSTYKEIPIELIKRVEVVMGPSSALYGQNAFMALVNIITKKAEDIDATIVTLKGGSHNTKVVNLHYGKKYDRLGVTANINSKKKNERIFVASQNKKTNPDTETFNAYLSLVHDSGFYFTGNFNNTNDKSNFGFMSVLNDIDYSKKETTLLEAGYKSSLDSNLDLHAKVYYDKFEIDNIWYIPFPSPAETLEYLHTTRRIGSELLLTYYGEKYSVVSGVSYEKQSVRDPYQGVLNGERRPNSIDEVDREFKALFSELLYDVNDNFRMNAGVRYDRYSDFGSTINPRIGSTYSINKTNTLKLMYGEAFRAPAFAELYNKNNTSIVGNRNLKPETIQTTEITFINNDIDNTQLSFTIFNSEIEDLILVSAAHANQYMNTGKIRTRGGKVELKYNLHRGSYVLANYSYQDAQNKTTNEDMPNVSKHLGYAALNYRASRDYNVYIDANYRGKQTRATGSSRDAIESATIVNATLNIKDIFVDNMKMKLSINNLFDKTTYDSDTWMDYQIAKRSFLATLSYKF